MVFPSTNLRPLEIIIKTFLYNLRLFRTPLKLDSIFSLVISYRESQSLVPCVYQYLYVRWLKKKNSNKVTIIWLIYTPPPPHNISIHIAIYGYREFCDSPLYIRNVTQAPNQHIKMISEGLFDTEAYSNSNGCMKIKLFHHRNNYNLKETVIL